MAKNTRPAGAKLWKSWLEAAGLTYGEAAAQLGVHRVSAFHWADGVKRPSAEHAEAIEVFTSGQVPASSWGRAKVLVRPFSKAS